MLRVDPVEQRLPRGVRLDVGERREHRVGEDSLVLLALLASERVRGGVGDEIAQHLHQIVGGEHGRLRGRQGLERARTDREARQMQRAPEGGHCGIACREPRDELDSHGARRVRWPVVDHIGQPRDESVLVAHLGRPLVIGKQRVGHLGVAGARDLDQEVCRLGVIERHQRRHARDALSLTACHPRCVLKKQAQQPHRLDGPLLHSHHLDAEAMAARKQPLHGLEALLAVRLGPRFRRGERDGLACGA